MNEFEQLYKRKQVLDENIAKNALFKLSVKEAIECVMIKVGMLFSMFQRSDYDKKQTYMKKLIRTNATYIDEIAFFQESLKWICRWCQEYCDNDGEQSEVVLAVQVYELMGLAFAYNEFVKYSFFHSKKVVSYRMFENCIQFDYVDEASHQVHEMYDTLNRKKLEENALMEVMREFQNDNDIKAIETVHRSDFIFSYNFNFGNFTLKDYEEISSGLNNYIMRRMLNNHILIPGDEGIIKCKRDKLVDMLIEECHDCEELFSAKERWFASNIFNPWQDHKQQIFVYDENLTYFIKLEKFVFRFGRVFL